MQQIREKMHLIGLDENTIDADDVVLQRRLDILQRDLSLKYISFLLS
jgi:hypothetical protein